MKKFGIEAFEEIMKRSRDCQMIDVREPSEFESEHMEGVLSVPLSTLREENVKILQKDKPVYVFCRSGSRACKAADQLEKFGFSDLVVVEGGLQAWMNAGKSVIRGPGRVWSLDRQVRFAAGTLVLTGIVLSEFVHSYWIGVSLFVAAGLIFSGVTDTCGMALFLARMPWNKRKGGAQ